jgi:hypothetical protein
LSALIESTEDLQQGYLFSCPLPIREFKKFLDDFSNKQSGDVRNLAVAAGFPFEI